MTFRNRVILLSSLLGVLVILYVVGLTQMTRRTGREEPLVAAGALEEINAVEVAGADGVSLRLEGAEGEWQLRLGDKLYPARGERVESMINALSDLRRNRTVSESAERHEQLGLTEEEATRLSLSRPEGTDIVLLFGEPAPQGGEAFVRFAEEDTAYAVDSALNFYFTQATSYWAELRLVRDIAAEEIVEISIEADDLVLLDPQQPVAADYTVTRGTGQEWNLTPGPSVELDATEVARVAGALTNFQAGDFVVSPEPGLFEREQATVSFTTQDGVRFRFVVGASLPENQFALRGEGPTVPRAADGEPLVFQIGAWSLERVFKNLDALRPQEEPETE